jgi:hypothetical protein
MAQELLQQPSYICHQLLRTVFVVIGAKIFIYIFFSCIELTNQSYLFVLAWKRASQCYTTHLYCYLCRPWTLQEESLGIDHIYLVSCNQIASIAEENSGQKCQVTTEGAYIAKSKYCFTSHLGCVLSSRPRRTCKSLELDAPEVDPSSE